MARHPEPRWFASRGGWYCQVDGKQHRLARGKANRKAALAAFHELMAARGKGVTAPTAGPTVHVLNRLFLDRVKAELKPLTYEWYVRHLKSFAAAHGERLAPEIRPHHVADWAGSKGWNATTKAGAVCAVKAAFAWGRKMGHLDSDPIKDLPRPRPKRREKVLSGESAGAVLEATEGKAFGDLLSFLRETGARPSEAARLTAADVDRERGLATLQEHKTDGSTGKPRVIVLSKAALDLVVRLAAEHPEGPLFLNSRGNAWTRWALSCAWRRLRPKLGLGHEATTVAFRHRFATDVSRTEPNGVVAALLGHASTKMVDSVYSHIRDEIDGPALEIMKKAVEKKRGSQ